MAIRVKITTNYEIVPKASQVKRSGHNAGFVPKLCGGDTAVYNTLLASCSSCWDGLGAFKILLANVTCCH
eukprot:1072205-Pleurochrysis_carterae.AAC.1